MKILVSGSSGLVGSALVKFLGTAGHEVARLVRTEPARPSEILWNPEGGSWGPSRLEGCDAVVHLAGESIATGRWTAAKKARIRQSRVRGTSHLSEALARLARPPKVLVSASAIGFYGNRGDETLRESSSPGSGFLPEVCQAWEKATEPASKAGMRVVHLRFGIILSPEGGALAKMLIPFRWGAGGVIGSGRQWMSWIALEDVVGAISHVLSAGSLQGPVNVVSSMPVTNQGFTKTLGKVLSRPTLIPMPAFAARLVLGEMADELLLASTRVEPARLLGSGYRFLRPDLEGALRSLLGK